MSADKLEDLRRTNKTLLERLSRKQEEFWERGISRIQEGRRPTRVSRDHSPVKEAPPLSLQGKSSIARKALATPRRTGPPEPATPLSSTPCDRAPASPGSSYDFITSKDVLYLRPPVKRLTLPGSTLSHTPPRPTAQYTDHLRDEGNRRTPKPALTTPNPSLMADPGSRSFLSSSADPHAYQLSGRPLLGYDWIAGLLEADSPFANMPEHFFSEINEFRRVNREECVHRSLDGSQAPDSSGSEEDPDVSLDSHQCVYCYRVNSRLFTSPAGPEAACPICKRRRGRRHAPEEPAYIRVSIPRSTLLPPHRYRAHRRKSFDPTDTLALPAHCLSGWENAAPSCSLRVSSLDLKASVEPSLEPTAPSSSSMGDVSAAGASSWSDRRARSEDLLNVSHSIAFRHHHRPRK